MAGIMGPTAFEGVPVDCPSLESMRQAYRSLLWLASNYESSGSPEAAGLLEGARCMVTCAFEIYGIHLDVEHQGERRRRYP